jgi:serine/threonine-protein kinase
MAEAAAARGRLPQLAKYEVLEEIGHGGMATVYRALDKRLGREVALKVIHPHLRDSREVVSRFHTEAKAVAKLRHPNIVEVFDVSEEDEPEQYLVVELLRGTTLRKLLQKHGVMPPEIAAAAALDLLGALAHANGSGVVHRDIKPENVLVEHHPAPDGTTPAPGSDRVVIKLTDFGIAKLLDAEGVTSTGQVLGSPAHMAPEQIEGGEVDARSDVFGLGVLLYECMVGHLPFEGNNPAQVLRRVLDGQYPEAQAERPVVGSRWSAVLDRALAHLADDRYADAGAMREAILAELQRLGIEAPRRELEAWLDDPASYEAAHAKRMSDKLVALGGLARKRGDVLSAAADYNRALAYAPDDPQLLRLVAGMNRAEARARLLRRGGAALAVMIGLGAATFGVGRFVRARFAADLPPPPAQIPSAPSTPSAIVAVAPPPSSTAQLELPSTAPVRTVAVAPRESAPKPTQRLVTLDLSPPMGVEVSVDGEPPHSASTGNVLQLDSKAHTLTFACAVCTPIERSIVAGDKDATVKVVVPIKPATLVIRGDVDKTYQIVEHPEIAVRAGTNTVALGRTFERVTVVQIETNKSIPVRLEAGQPVPAVF